MTVNYFLRLFTEKKQNILMILGEILLAFASNRNDTEVRRFITALAQR